MVCKKIEQSASPTDGAPRLRRPHAKSRSGCSTCKKRHIKCDENKPQCNRCRTAGLSCESETRPARPKGSFKAFRPVIVGPAVPSPFKIKDDCKMALEYFHSFSLPVISRSEPSPVWTHMLHEIYSDSGLCHIVAAIGHQHRYMLEASSSSEEDAQDLYTRSIRSLREFIADQGHMRRPTVVFSCLLLAVLQSLRGRFAEMLIHLQYGTHVALEAASDPGDMQECVRLLKKTTINAVLFDMASQEAQSALGFLEGADDYTPAPDPRDLEDDKIFFVELQYVLVKLIRIMNVGQAIQSREDGSITLARDFHVVPDLAATHADLTTRQRALELAVTQKLESCETDSTRRPFLQLARARCLISGVFLRCAWEGSQTAYDQEIEVFREMNSLIESALLHIQAIRGGHLPGTYTFSLGLGVIPLLSFVADLCRDSATRRKAVQLIDLCPRREGLWTAQLAKTVTTAIITFEEQQAAKSPGFEVTGTIPDHCRVYHTHLPAFEYSIGRPERKHIRLFRMVDSDSTTFWHDDVEIEV